jgi:hypothetical protein
MSSVPEKAHSELGASVSSRWMACPGSVALSRGRPNYATEHSRAGTAAHAVGELALRKGLDPDTWIGTTLEGVKVDEEMAAAVAVYTSYCQSLMRQSTQWWIEHRFTLAELNPPGPMFGTCDFAAYGAGARELEIVDYKNGSGVVVEVRGNKQLRYYALGAVLSLGKGIQIDTVKMTIVQPRASHPDGVVRSETIDYLDLLAFAGELMEAARATLDPAAPLHPGSHCRFCPASAVCPAQAAQAQALAQVAFADLPVEGPPAPAALDPETFADMLGKLHILEEWAAAMRAHAFNEMKAGRPIPGFKLVAGRQGNRQWSSEKEVEKWLWDEKGLREDEMYKPRTLKSPAQIEKSLGKGKAGQAAVEPFVSRSEGQPVMVREDDPRPGLALAAGDAFAALPSGE